jgi:predicted HNH restriction endonuclease
MRICGKCKQERSESEFYSRGKRGGFTSYCKFCNTTDIRERAAKRKQEFVDYKGGKCELCGYDKNIAALDFHHVDPSIKESKLSDFRSLAAARVELDKCILICSNCHRELHYNASLAQR